LVNNINHTEHIKIGHALQKLEHDNLLVIGFGFSFHNMNAFLAVEAGESKTINESFENGRLATFSNRDIDEEQRTQRLIK